MSYNTTPRDALRCCSMTYSRACLPCGGGRHGEAHLTQRQNVCGPPSAGRRCCRRCFPANSLTSEPVRALLHMASGGQRSLLVSHTPKGVMLRVNLVYLQKPHSLLHTLAHRSPSGTLTAVMAASDQSLAS